VKRRRSLRYRLTLWYTGLLGASLTILSVVLFLSLSYNLQRHHDHGMLHKCDDVRTMIKQTGECGDPEMLAQFGMSRELGHAVIVRPVRETDVIPPPGAGTAGILLQTRKGVEGAVRVAWTVYEPPDGSTPCLIEVTDNLGDLDETVDGVKLLLMMLVPTVIIVASVGGFLMTRKGLQPLENIVQLTKRVEASRLGLRLEVQEAPREIADLAVTVNQMIGRLEASFAQMKRFTADASHELRTPLAVLTTSIEVTLQRERSSQAYREALEGALKEAQQLTSIVEDLLVFAQAEAGKLELQVEQVEMGSFLRRCVAALEPLAAAGGLTLKAQELESATMPGDSRWLRQMFENLLDNAVKYTPAGGSVAVRSYRHDGKFIVEICDTGIGIAAEEIPRIFDRFYRVDPSRNQEAGGSGLGLSIAQWVARSHGGRLEVESTLGSGSVFRVILPGRSGESGRL